MPTILRHLGTGNAATAFPATIERRSIAVNTANLQIALGNENAPIGTPLPLLGVRIFVTTAQYAINDLAVNAGTIYRAKVTVTPGAFNAANWDAVGPLDTTGFVLVDGTRAMTGALSLIAGNPSGGQHATHKTYVDAGDTAANTNANTRVLKAGDTMSGALILPAASPTLGTHATNKTYVDAADTANTTAIGLKVAKGGDTMTGLLTLSADPSSALHAAPKQYVDLRVLKAGDTMTGMLTLPVTTPSNNQHAAHKKYVDDSVAAVAGGATVVADGVTIVGNGLAGSPLTVNLLDCGTF